MVRKSIDVSFKRIESQMIWLSDDSRFQVIWLSSDLRLKRIWLSVDSGFKWFGCQLIWDSSDLVVNWFGNQVIWDSNDLVANRCEIQVIWLSIDLRFKSFGCQLIWDSNDLDVKWFEMSKMKLWTLKLKIEAFVRDLLQKWSFEAQKRSISARLPSKLKLWNSKTKHFCETSFKIEALKLKNEAFLRDFLQKWSFEAQKRSFSARLPARLKLWTSKNKAFLRDFLQNWSFEAQKRSFSARLPSKMKLWNSKTKHFCETSFKNEALKLKKRSFFARLPSKLKLWSSKTKLFCETSCKNEALQLQNEAFLRDFLQKWNFEAQKTKLFCETSFKNDMSTGHLTSELQYVLAIFNCMLQKYCACHEKVAPRHTNSCNCHAKWSLQSNTSVTWNLQPFHGFSVGCFKHRHHKARNHCACHAKRIVPDPLEIHHACQRFCNPHELLRLPRILQRVEIPAPATQNTLSTSKNVPRPSVFNDFDFQIALARRRGAIFAKLNFQKPAETLKF